MGMFIRRLFWFILVVASGLVAALLGAKQYGINVDLNTWAKISGLHEIPEVIEIINRIPALLDFPIIKSYGFYGSLVLLLIFLLKFTMSLRSGRKDKVEAVHAENTKAAFDNDDAPNSTESSPDRTVNVLDRLDSAPDSLSETFNGSSTATEFIAETNSDAVVGTDGKVYDGTATFSGTDTYGHIDSRPEFYADTEAEADTEDESNYNEEAEGDISSVEDDETRLSHLTDAELKSKTLDFLEEIRSFEVDFQNNRDETTAELIEFAGQETSRDDLLNVKNTYEQRQTVFSSEFESKYRPEAVTFRHEISKRLGISASYDNSSPALDIGMLVGANPIADVADLIEELVKELA